MVRIVPVSRVSPEMRALLSYSVSNRAISTLPMIQLRREIEAEMDEIRARVFRDVERALAEAADDGTLAYGDPGADGPRFQYDTRLLMPALLTLARLHIRAGDVPLRRRIPGTPVDSGLVERGHRTTEHITRALLDGDLRDALNDEEYEDVSTNLEPRKRVAEVAQRCLQASVEAWFDDPATPTGVQRHYSHAVSLSESHQEADEVFAELLDRFHATPTGERDAVTEEIRDRYKFASPSDGLELFDEEVDLPYFVTQYERVGILYEDMLGMYEADLGIEIDPGFKRAVVLMVVAAQIGLDDTDDYEEDKGDQLTPVTAELALGEDDARSVERLRTVVETYLDRAEASATDHLTGVAIEYIRQESRDRLDGLRRTLGAAGG